MPSPKRIGQIEFGLLSPKEIREMSVRKIIWADTYDDDGFPYPQGLMDLNLGVIDPGLRCKTCDQKASECPGHFGHIELAKPVIHVGYTRLIRKLLRVTCRSCGRVLLSPDEIEKVVGTEDDQTGDILSEKDVKKERICPHCGMVAMLDRKRNMTRCLACGNETDIYSVEMSYAFKLLLDEMKSMGIAPRLRLQDVV